jgi:hypothetical protein
MIVRDDRTGAEGVAASTNSQSIAKRVTSSSKLRIESRLIDLLLD